ncbi:Similarity (plasmid) [Planktothrix rubescens]|nr:Similarity [Planktothrix rubescens]
MTLQEVLKSVDNLSIADQVLLLEQLKKRFAQIEESDSEVINQAQKEKWVKSLRGMAANSRLSSEDFAQHKQAEIDQEVITCYYP